MKFDIWKFFNISEKIYSTTFLMHTLITMYICIILSMRTITPYPET